MSKKVLVLGCTGSIGTNTIDVLNQFPEIFKVIGLTANTAADKLSFLGDKYKCKTLLTSKCSQLQLNDFIQSSDADIVVNGISGSAGLLPTISAITSNKNIALANKETIVMAGSIVKELANKHNVKILPVDSEHSAVFNLIERFGKDYISEVVLTASGGPFREFSLEQLRNVTLQDALHHPTWSMGNKITIDSASLANKGLEVIEAAKLFDIAVDKIKVTIHPQSIVHSLIRTNDGVLYGQLSYPDMRHPILSALTWPSVLQNNMKPLDFSSSITENLSLTFSGPNLDVFRMLQFAYDALKLGDGATIAYNAANEIAVELFLQERISFLDIPVLTDKILQISWDTNVTSVEQVFSIDKEVRTKVLSLL